MFRVALTTTADRVEALGDLARRHGLDPVSLPCIEVSPVSEPELARARGLAGEADWVVVTSSRAIDVLWPDGGMPDVPVSAVGSATEEAVTKAGGQVVLTGDDGAEALVEKLASQVREKTVFFPHASGAAPSTIEALERAGADVRAVVVYDTHSIAPGSDPVDAAVFGSPSAVSGWLKGRSLGHLVLAAIGETTAAALEHAGYQPDVVPARPDFDLLISRLAEFLRERSPV